MRRYRTYRPHPILRRWFIVLLLLIGTAIIIDWQIRPLVKSVAANQAQIASTKAINEAVQQELMENQISYDQLVKIERGNDGKVLAVTTDVAKTNLLKASISTDIQEKLSSTKPKSISIPLGTLTGTEILSGRGPMIEMKISLPSSVFTEFKSTFTSAGINQTKHQIHLKVNTEVYALIPGFPTTTTVDTNIIVAETVIVGEVPNVVANLSPANSGAIADFAQMVQ